jgi:hypothetical protein
MPTIGDLVIYVDKKGIEHDALLTAVHDGVQGFGWEPPKQGIIPNENPSVNLVYVSDDYHDADSYGRQIVREASCVHKTKQGASGNYWVEA